MIAALARASVLPTTFGTTQLGTTTCVKLVCALVPATFVAAARREQV